jgi:YARHG domain
MIPKVFRYSATLFLSIRIPSVIRRSGLAMAALVWLIAGPASYAQSFDPHKPEPLGPGVNKGNVDGGTGSHYYYFLAGPGHVNVKMAFLEMGIFGNPRQEVLSFDFYNESGELMSHNPVVSFDRLERIETGVDFGSRQKIVLAIVPQKGLVRLGGYYEVEVTGAGTFDRGTAAGPDVTPRDTSLVHPGGSLVRPGGALLAPGQGEPSQPPNPGNVSSTAQPGSPYPGERYPQTRQRLLTMAEVDSLSYAQLRYAINEMYARHGAAFPSQRPIEAQFRKFPWYRPNPTLTFEQIEASFSQMEKDNLELLRQARDQKRR